MLPFISGDKLRFFLNRFQERLWVKPLAVCLLSIAAAFLAKLADWAPLSRYVPAIASDSIETLLSIMASSMLVIATFSVGAMVSAYASASNTATPRSFALVIADDASQNALSTFVGAFIHSIVALIAVKNDYFQPTGTFILFIITLVVFGIVIVTFVRWVDSIARLGRMGSTIEKVEQATLKALMRRKQMPTLCGVAIRSHDDNSQPVFATEVGYVQHVDIAHLQSWAEATESRVEVAALPGKFVSPGRPLVYVSNGSENVDDHEPVINAFQIGSVRLFDDDPRFGLVVLSEIGSRALSPAVNDQGTAISIAGTLLRLFTQWTAPIETDEENLPRYDRVEVPELSVQDMFDDAFTAIARDGAGSVEVAVRLQKTFHSLTFTGNKQIRDAAIYHGRLALKRSQEAMGIAEDLAAVRDAAGYLEVDGR